MAAYLREHTVTTTPQPVIVSMRRHLFGVESGRVRQPSRRCAKIVTTYPVSS